MLERFNNFLKKAFPENFEKYTMDFSSIDKHDLTKIRSLWDQYLYGEYKIQDSIEQALILKHVSDSIAQVLVLQDKLDSMSQIDSNNNLTLNQENRTIDQLTNNEDTTKETINFQAEEPKLVQESAVSQEESAKYRKQKVKIRKKVSNFFPGDVEYRVQIAASRIPMKETELSAIYLGPVKFTELYEDNWYKYVSDPFANYNEANNFRISSNVSGAFVVYYHQGQRIKKPEGINFYENIYKIQIAASKKPLHELEIETIYSGAESIEIQYSGIWYHYLIHSGVKFTEARKKLNDIPVKGAFIVIYKGGKRIYPPLPEKLK